ncbi:hypothetical protein BCR41DRAFT_73548 [Lobosporangium transversale]|uniref:Uncharacterized protein n=1 Tax=Lobosporangium transversale TaxID=64571 RepID=A0A1Y2H5T6_9FUNG|nr:hypothetical protein BCR41DRAFT_73548 [Lobosporangium transversale]ORZ28412.1 hypothetical protein BCR41DRAFT_73548 [Lobosporangium transversale]|eukprot:XP_021886097.1 hypothetical protein BCR41DRAFT_73548 [Lobosporangium transversale]
MQSELTQSKDIIGVHECNPLRNQLLSIAIDTFNAQEAERPQKLEQARQRCISEARKREEEAALLKVRLVMACRFSQDFNTNQAAIREAIEYARQRAAKDNGRTIMITGQLTSNGAVSTSSNNSTNSEKNSSQIKGSSQPISKKKTKSRQKPLRDETRIQDVIDKYHELDFFLDEYIRLVYIKNAGLEPWQVDMRKDLTLLSCRREVRDLIGIYWDSSKPLKPALCRALETLVVDYRSVNAGEASKLLRTMDGTSIEEKRVLLIQEGHQITRGITKTMYASNGTLDPYVAAAFGFYDDGYKGYNSHNDSSESDDSLYSADEGSVPNKDDGDNIPDLVYYEDDNNTNRMDRLRDGKVFSVLKLCDIVVNYQSANPDFLDCSEVPDLKEYNSEDEKESTRWKQQQEEEKVRAERLLQEKEREKRKKREQIVEAERIAREKAEAERIAKEEAKRAAKERAETERIAKEKAEAGRIAKEKAEAEQIARDKAKAEKIAREKVEAERIAKEKAEAERIARQKAEAERIAKEKLEAEKIARKEAEKEKLAKEKEMVEGLYKENKEAERAAREKEGNQVQQKVKAQLIVGSQESDGRKKYLLDKMIHENHLTDLQEQYNSIISLESNAKIRKNKMDIAYNTAKETELQAINTAKDQYIREITRVRDEQIKKKEGQHSRFTYVRNTAKEPEKPFDPTSAPSVVEAMKAVATAQLMKDKVRQEYKLIKEEEERIANLIVQKRASLHALDSAEGRRLKEENATRERLEAEKEKEKERLRQQAEQDPVALAMSRKEPVRLTIPKDTLFFDWQGINLTLPLWIFPSRLEKEMDARVDALHSVSVHVTERRLSRNSGCATANIFFYFLF